MGILEKRLLGGIFLILSGIFGLVMVVLLFIGSAALDAMPGVSEDADVVSSVTNMCAAIFAIFAIVALLGGVMAMMGKMWGLALIGGIMGLFTIGPYLLGSVFALIGLIFVAMSKDEFGPKQTMPPGYMPPPGYVPPPGATPPPMQPPQYPPPQPPAP